MPAMTLDEYLTAEKETAEAFGARIGRSTSTITRLRKGETRPDWDTLDLIIIATDQKVTPNDFSPALRVDGVTPEAAE